MRWWPVPVVLKKEKPACKYSVEPFTGLPVFDLQGQYPEKEIILQDIADVRYVVLETGDSSLVGTRTILMTDSLLVTVNKKSDVIFFDKSGKYLHSFNHTGDERRRIWGCCQRLLYR
ncbi:DUF4934 domain-containing protein [Bacteroides fragilis]|nr:DUF4934 domain-containing protein [Bacteroides fragilis]